MINKQIVVRRMMRLLGLGLLVASSVQVQAQQTTGSIIGTVKDQQGAVVNTATVKATNVDTGYSRSAPANGIRGVPNRLSSCWQVHASQAKAAGFEGFVQENLALDVDQTLTVEIKLVRGRADSDHHGHRGSPAGQYL